MSNNEHNNNRRGNNNNCNNYQEGIEPTNAPIAYFKLEKNVKEVTIEFKAFWKINKKHIPPYDNHYRKEFFLNTV